METRQIKIEETRLSRHYYLCCMNARYWFWFISFPVLLACQKEVRLTTLEYHGPLLEQEKIEVLHSDSTRIILRLVADYEQDFDNGDKEFPRGIYIEFYEDDGRLSSTLKAQKGFYFKVDDLYKGLGDVVVRNVINQEQLNTEELFWKPAEKRIFTDKFVRIETQEEILLGEGLEAEQDFSSYTITQPTGVISIDEQEEEEQSQP